MLASLGGAVLSTLSTTGPTARSGSVTLDILPAAITVAAGAPAASTATSTTPPTPPSPGQITLPKHAGLDLPRKPNNPQAHPIPPPTRRTNHPFGVP